MERVGAAPSRGFLAIKDEAAARVLIAVTRMITASPALRARATIFARYSTALAQLVADEGGASAGDLRPYEVANALIGAHRALISWGRTRAALFANRPAEGAVLRREFREPALPLAA